MTSTRSTLFETAIPSPSSMNSNQDLQKAGSILKVSVGISVSTTVVFLILIFFLIYVRQRAKKRHLTVANNVAYNCSTGRIIASTKDLTTFDNVSYVPYYSQPAIPDPGQVIDNLAYNKPSMGNASGLVTEENVAYRVRQQADSETELSGDVMYAYPEPAVEETCVGAPSEQSYAYIEAGAPWTH